MDKPASDNSAIYDARRGTWRHHLINAFHSEEQLLEVRLPDRYDPARRYPVVYLLPCEAGEDCQFGDPMLEVMNLSPTLREQCIFARPSFDTIPWYAHHVDDPRIVHDAYLRTVVIPWVEQHYATTTTAGRLLLGFSKSGWGAFSLLARYPDFFTAAASWDAPLFMDIDCFGAYGTARHFGAPAHFVRFRPPALLQANPAPFQRRPRLVLAGQQVFGSEAMPPGAGSCHTAAMHEFLQQIDIPHHYHNDLVFPHAWHAGWMEPLLRALLCV